MRLFALWAGREAYNARGDGLDFAEAGRQDGQIDGIERLTRDGREECVKVCQEGADSRGRFGSEDEGRVEV
jgi:hypothetical protein